MATPCIANAGFSFRSSKANVSTFQMVHKWVFSKNFNRLTLDIDPEVKKVESVSWHNLNAVLTQELCQFKQFQRGKHTVNVSSVFTPHQHRDINWQKCKIRSIIRGGGIILKEAMIYVVINLKSTPRLQKEIQKPDYINCHTETYFAGYVNCDNL